MPNTLSLTVEETERRFAGFSEEASPMHDWLAFNDGLSWCRKCGRIRRADGLISAPVKSDWRTACHAALYERRGLVEYMDWVSGLA